MVNKENEYDVIVIGGGATGAGTARDCALRGLRVLLLERFDFASGATGRTCTQSRLAWRLSSKHTNIIIDERMYLVIAQ